MQIADRLRAIAEVVGGKAWGLHIGQPRVYLSTRLVHAKVFLAFPKALGDNLGRPVLRVQHKRPRRPYPSKKRITTAEYRSVLLTAQQWVEKNE